METTRRDVLKAVAAAGALAAAGPALAQTAPNAAADRVFVCNEDSNTLAVIDPGRNEVVDTVNLTSFDEDPRPPFRFATGGVAPAHGAMIQKPLYHGAISIHGAAPSPDSRLVATTGRGSSNVYLIETATRRVIGNTPNPQAGDSTNKEHLTTGILVGREPHEPTFTRDGKQLWVTVRGEERIAVIDVAPALEGPSNVRPTYLPTILGPAQVWFSRDGAHAFVVSQKVAALDVIATATGRRAALLDLKQQDPFAFTPFEKTTPDGTELWLSHKLADRLSVVETTAPFRVIESIDLGRMARPNHVEFVENARGRAVYASLGRVDDGGPGGAASSRIAIIDRSAPAGQRKVVGTFFSHGREAHANPEGTLLYIAHEQDEVAGTPSAGQTVATAFDVSDPFSPRFIAQIPLGELALPSGRLRNKKSINLVYVRPGARSQAG